MVSFSMCQEAVRRETTEGSSIEFMAYRIPQEQQSYSQGINQEKVVRLFRYSDWLTRYSHLKLEYLKISGTLCVNEHHRKKYVKCQNLSTQFGLLFLMECSDEISRQSVKFTYPINSLKVEVFLQNSNAKFQLVKVRKQLEPRLEIITPNKPANIWKNRTSQCL